MPKEPSVPPYVLHSPPAYGATYQQQPDRQTAVPRAPATNGSQRVPENDGFREESDVDGVAVQPKGSVFDQFWARFRPVSLSKDEGQSDETPDDDSASGVVHSITKKTDFWFDREVFTLEREN